MGQTVAVLGAGSWGTALALVLARNGHEVYLWSIDKAQVQAMRRERCNRTYLPDNPLPDNLHSEYELSHVLSLCRDVLIAVPSSAFAEVVEQLSHLP